MFNPYCFTKCFNKIKSTESCPKKIYYEHPVLHNTPLSSPAIAHTLPTKWLLTEYPYWINQFLHKKMTWCCMMADNCINKQPWQMPPSLPPCRHAQGTPSSGDPRSRAAAARREPGGAAHPAVPALRCDGERGREPDDAHQPGRVSGAVTLPPQHSPPQRELLSQVCECEQSGIEKLTSQFKNLIYY